MPDPTRQPVFRTALADNVGVVLSFAAVGIMGSAYITNKGPDACWVVFDGLPAAASFGNGRKQLAVGECMNLDDIVYSTIGALCAGADTAQVEAVGVIRPGSSGQGLN